jgi:hypothetical protein
MPGGVFDPKESRPVRPTRWDLWLALLALLILADLFVWLGSTDASRRS